MTMEKSYSGRERRRHKRVKVSFIVVYRGRKPLDLFMIVGNQEMGAIMLDLSEGGMAIITEYDVPVSTVLSIKFTLINHEAADEDKIRAMSMTGEVRHNIPVKREHRLGISFTDISEEDRRAIASFVAISSQEPA